MVKITNKKTIKTHNKIHNKTQKKNIFKKSNKKNGWLLVTVKGNPYERGFQHGDILRKQILKIYEFFPLYVKKEMGFTFKTYMEKCKELIPIIKSNCYEIYEEMQGIVDGVNCTSFHIKNPQSNQSNRYNSVTMPECGDTTGILNDKISLEFIIAWNSIMSLWKNHVHKKIERCSVFIATGSYTESGEVVMAHNTHIDFMTGQYVNIIMRIYPDKGHSFVMQTSPGLIWSLTDWFITDAGIIGCESTISDINYNPVFGLPIFCRIRKVMQYAKTLDECADILKKNSAGDYSCSWLFGNIKTNEIMLFEQGLKYHNIQKTKDGVFYVANSVIDPTIRAKETLDKTIFDPKQSSGSRMLRLGQLLTIDYFGKLNAESAKKIIADHYDVSLGKKTLNNQGICNHNETLKKKAIPFGAVDGKVTTSALAKKGSFIGRWGSSCGRPFHARQFLKNNPQYKKWGEEYLPDFPKQLWTVIDI